MNARWRYQRGQGMAEFIICMPIVAQAIVRMQSPALQSQAMSNGIPGAGNSAGNPGSGNGNPPGNGNSTPGTADNGGNVPPIGPPGDNFCRVAF